MANHSEKHPTLQVAAAIAQFLLVRLSAGKLAVCGVSDDDCLGSTQKQTFAADEYVAIRPLQDDGTHKLVAAGAIAVGADVYQAAGGKVAATGTVRVGTAMTVATADGDYIIVMPMRGRLTPFLPTAAQQALSGAGAVNVTSYYTAVTTTGANALTLADGTRVGQLKKVQLIVDAGDGTLTPDNFANGTTITFADAGDYALLLWDGSNWNAIEVGNDTDGATAPVIA